MSTRIRTYSEQKANYKYGQLEISHISRSLSPTKTFVLNLGPLPEQTKTLLNLAIHGFKSRVVLKQDTFASVWEANGKVHCSDPECALWPWDLTSDFEVFTSEEIMDKVLPEPGYTAYDEEVRKMEKLLKRFNLVSKKSLSKGFYNPWPFNYGGKGQACELDCFRDNFDFLLLEDFYGNTKVVIHLNSSQATLKKLSSKELECKRIYKLFYHAILMNLAWIWSKLSKIANDDGYIKIPMSSKLEFAYLSKNKDKMEDTFKLHGDLAGFTFDHQFKQFKVDFLQGSRKPAFDAWPRILRITVH